MKKIAITIGDPSGVGAEIILDWVFRNPNLHSYAEIIAHDSFLRNLPESVSKRQVGDSSYKAIAGNPDSHGALIAKLSLESAAQGCLDGIYSGVVTAPISKACMKSVGFNYAGHTEFFADKWGGEPVMAFAGKKLLLALVTWHIPLKTVSESLNFNNISRACESASKLAKCVLGVESPRIAVCGLNPHAGEDGILGREEIELINPILKKLRSDYSNLSDSLPPDTVFARTLKGEFDSIVSMYHDQALAPLKALEFDNAVNVTMNLPFVRTSPDHGTGFGIAGKGIASSNSFSAAFELAMKLINERNS